VAAAAVDLGEGAGEREQREHQPEAEEDDGAPREGGTES
jgi:hypothetical protein